MVALAILFHFLCAQHVWDINISIITSLWLFFWITTLVCVLERTEDLALAKHVERIRSEIKIASDIKLVFCFQLSQWCTVQ